MNGSCDAHEEAARAPGAAKWPGDGGPRGARTLGDGGSPQDLPSGTGGRSSTNGCADCFGSLRLAPCPTASGRASATGRPKRRLIPERSWKLRWRLWCTTKVEAAYRRSDLFDRRRRLMNDWAAYLAGNRAAARHDHALER